MATGSQGEPSAVLGRLATGQHRSLDVMEGDTIVVSAHTIPGNEETVSRTINKLFQRGAEVIYDPIAPVHVSGHACQEEMKLLMSLTNPKYFMPIHGETRHLAAHARLRSCRRGGLSDYRPLGGHRNFLRSRQGTAGGGQRCGRGGLSAGHRLSPGSFDWRRDARACMAASRSDIPKKR